jgi:hypothetical protein
MLPAAPIDAARPCSDDNGCLRGHGSAAPLPCSRRRALSAGGGGRVVDLLPLIDDVDQLV